jgi:hypothetical protein
MYIHICIYTLFIHMCDVHCTNIHYLPLILWPSPPPCSIYTYIHITKYIHITYMHTYMNLHIIHTYVRDIIYMNKYIHITFKCIYLPSVLWRLHLSPAPSQPHPCPLARHQSHLFMCVYKHGYVYVYIVTYIYTDVCKHFHI